MHGILTRLLGEKEKQDQILAVLKAEINIQSTGRQSNGAKD